MAIASNPTIRTNQRTDLAPIILAGIPFRNSTASLIGERTSGNRLDILHSWLDDEARAAFYADADADSIDYVVWSYGTPIAWHHEDGWTMPEKRYSVTTSKHQGQVRRALSGNAPVRVVGAR